MVVNCVSHKCEILSTPLVKVVYIVVVVVVVEIFIHGAVKATITNAPQSQLNK